MTEKNFICSHCQKTVNEDNLIGTHNRNHCPKCLWSKHIDLQKSGDRMANCKNPMEPIGLTFKQERIDKYGKTKQGELMIVHQCEKCGKISLNRIAGDDKEEEILKLLENPPQKEFKGIKVLGLEDKEEVERQLYGKAF
jgi:DNA-directed RNA polymerase subunit RPC12/RpoP